MPRDHFLKIINMSILTNLNHLTRYTYERPISMGVQTIRLRPAPHTRSHIQSYSLNITPKAHFINWQQDPFGNYLAKIVFHEKVKEFKVEVNVVSETRVFDPFDFFLEESAKHFPFKYDAELKEELAPYLEIKENSPSMKKWLKANIDLKTEQEMINFLVAFNRKLHQSLKYTLRMEPGVQGCEETFELGSGSCRDMSWLLCQLLRTLGFATRFASGYLIQLTADLKALDGPSGTTEDFTDLHAWTEVYLPGAGWVGLDATSGLFTGEGHIPLCCTPNPSSAAPISGTLEACESELEHEMTITRIKEEARVTRPYTDKQWQDIDALGEQVDADLVESDVRLTMGGEPTFVSLDDKVGTEWHYTALSDNKKKLGNDLFLRLKDKFAPGSLLQHCQGKWYPGEILPRWAMNCYWRRDELPIWENADLLANPEVDLKHDLTTAKKFMTELSKAMGVPASYVLEAKEDTPYYLWKEQALPLEGEILKSDLYEKRERARLQKLLGETLNNPVGYVLPLGYSATRNQWVSNAWKFRTEHLILAIGDSPVGLRLPMASIPFCQNSNQEIFPERVALEQVDKLATRKVFAAAIKKRTEAVEKSAKKPIYAKDENGLTRTALCAEVRNGVLHLFLPPLSLVEHFLELMVAIEGVAKKLKTPVVLEGYMPPKDLRMNSFSVTPDPGVIEVNIQPAENWGELKNIITTVYDEARESRLSTDKFLLDGRRVGTGGGNHIVMGAKTPEDSPFLRKPDVLKSMIAFWQNHPSLSYLFSSMYIGPTSQAPRIDEARHDSLYELEIAFDQMGKIGYVQPWTVDRLFRNLLVDLAGNTHRAEFCIDKLYSPDSDRGRLGLLEMRGFEMTPHAQMNLVQALLIRACVAHFWKFPYHQKLIRWGTRLHDDYMLPHFVWEDMRDILNMLNSAGYNFKLEWFEPFFAFRFPEYGSVQIGDMTLEVKMALEPWPVLGEEMGGSGVSRAVDSSVERLQVLVRGMTGSDRYVVTCNGRRLPLKETSEPGVFVAGVRYKAWAPPSSLHPTIPAHAPLVFDVIDTLSECSLGGCTYTVAHPGGRNFDEDDIPVNDNAAEGRRLSRFLPMGHTPGYCPAPPKEHNPNFPNTLDLRYSGD